MSEEKNERRVVILTGSVSPAQTARTIAWLREHGTDVVVTRHRSGLPLDAPPDRYCDDRAATFRALYGDPLSIKPRGMFYDDFTAMRRKLNKRKARRRARTGRK